MTFSVLIIQIYWGYTFPSRFFCSWCPQRLPEIFLIIPFSRGLSEFTLCCDFVELLTQNQHWRFESEPTAQSSSVSISGGSWSIHCYINSVIKFVCAPPKMSLSPAITGINKSLSPVSLSSIPLLITHNPCPFHSAVITRGREPADRRDSERRQEWERLSALLFASPLSKYDIKCSFELLSGAFILPETPALRRQWWGGERTSVWNTHTHTHTH